MRDKFLSIIVVTLLLCPLTLLLLDHFVVPPAASDPHTVTIAFDENHRPLGMSVGDGNLVFFSPGYVYEVVTYDCEAKTEISCIQQFHAVPDEIRAFDR